jgi:uridylate kinase
MTYNDVIDGRLRVMDFSAIDVCQRHSVPIIVFNLFKPGTMRRVVLGEPLGTFVGES